MNLAEAAAPPTGTREASAPPPTARRAYLALLTGSFTVFNAVRVVAYVPTLWALVQSGDSTQHSVFTWAVWAGANLSMAGWLHEQNGRRWSRATVVNLGNAAMCLATLAVIVALRV